MTFINIKASTKDIEKLKSRFYETSSYDISDEKNRKNFDYFYKIVSKEKI